MIGATHLSIQFYGKTSRQKKSRDKENILDFPCHVFSITQVGKCDAKGYYNTMDCGFYILKGSLVSAEFETVLSSSPLHIIWKNFIDEHCELCSAGRNHSFKVKKVKEDFRCDRASIAASLVWGRAANNAHWRDSDGHLLKDISIDVHQNLANVHCWQLVPTRVRLRLTLCHT